MNVSHRALFGISCVLGNCKLARRLHHCTPGGMLYEATRATNVTVRGATSTAGECQSRRRRPLSPEHLPLRRAGSM